MKYKCVNSLCLDKYDDDGFLIENKYFVVPTNSVWEIDEDKFRMVGSSDTIRLDRVWKKKNAKTSQWMEISKDTLEKHFELVA